MLTLYYSSLEENIRFKSQRYKWWNIFLPKTDRLAGHIQTINNN